MGKPEERFWKTQTVFVGQEGKDSAQQSPRTCAPSRAAWLPEAVSTAAACTSGAVIGVKTRPRTSRRDRQQQETLAGADVRGYVPVGSSQCSEPSAGARVGALGTAAHPHCRGRPEVLLD